MARLPDAQALGERPVPQPRGGIPSIANAGIAEGVEASAATKGVSEFADKLAAAGEKIWAREDDIQYLASSRKHRELTDAQTLKTLTSADLSSPDSVKKHNQEVTNIEQQTLESFGGRENARIKLAANLQQYRFNSIAQVAAASTKAQHDVVISEVGRYRNDLSGKMALGDIDYSGATKKIEDFVNARALPPHTKPSLISDVKGELAEQEISRILPQATADPVGGPAKMENAISIFAQAVPDMKEERRDRVVKLFEAMANPPRVLSPKEASNLGFLPGTVVQRDNTGLKVLQTPPASQVEREAKIKNYAGMMARTQPEWTDQQRIDEATKLIDKEIEYQYDSSQGMWTRLDKTTNQSTVLPSMPLQEPGAKPPPPENVGLYNRAAKINEVAGIKGAAKDAFSRTAGQTTSEFVDTETEKVRTEAKFAQEALVRAMILSHGGGRESEAQVKHLEKLIDIAPSIWSSHAQLLSRMQEIDRNIRINLETETEKLTTPGLSGKTLSQTRETINAYRGFLKRLGYNPAPPPEGIPLGSIQMDKPYKGKKAWKDPRGGLWVE